jgi:hypothetical protein
MPMPESPDLSRTDDTPHRPIIDVDRLVEDLRERAQGRRDRGELDRRTLEARIDIRPERISLRPEVAYSAKPVIGPVITGTKRFLIRLQYHFLNDVIAQTNRSIELARAQTAAEVQRRRDLEDRIADLEARLTQAEAALVEQPPAPGVDPPSQARH